MHPFSELDQIIKLYYKMIIETNRKKNHVHIYKFMIASHIFFKSLMYKCTSLNAQLLKIFLRLIRKIIDF